MTHSTAKIDIRNLQKKFGDKHILKEVSLSVMAGQSLCVIGTSGCGKSVTLKCLLGLITPDGGSILVDGHETVGQPRRKREEMLLKFGMTFQFGAVFDSLPIWQNIMFRPLQRGYITYRDARGEAAKIISQLGLESRVLDQFPAELSGGMQKRVALARAIADKPEILLFDEPTSGLDPITGRFINNLIADSVRRLGATAITISHDMASVHDISDRVAMLHKGHIIWSGPTAEMSNTDIAELTQFVEGNLEGPLTAGTAKSVKPNQTL